MHTANAQTTHDYVRRIEPLSRLSREGLQKITDPRENDLFGGPIYTQFNDNRSLDQDGNFAGNFREWSTRGTDWQPGLLITSTFVDLAFPSPFPGKIKSCSTNRTLSALASSSFYLTEEESGSILLSQGVQGTTRVLVFNFTPRKCGDIISQ